MSILLCDGCSDPIDTDNTPAAYNHKTNRWLCESCRTNEEEQDEPVRARTDWLEP